MIICDTHALIFWALVPERLSAQASVLLEEGREAANLACADISLWEIAMAVARGSIRVSVPAGEFITDVLEALRLDVIPITPRIAELSQDPRFTHGDPADRLIGATALAREVPLLTVDQRLQAVEGLKTIW